MNLSSFRRALLRPLTPAAHARILAGDLPAPTDIELYRIPEDLYQKHFQLFNDLDRICGVAADDHAAEEVEPTRLPLVIKTLRSYPCPADRPLEDMLDRMWGLCHRAKESDLPAFLIL